MAIREDKLILVAQDLNGSIQKGIIKVKEKEFFVAFHLKSKSNLSDARFRCDWELKALLHGYEDMLKKRLQSCKTIAEFLNEVHYLATTLLSERERRTGSKTLNKPSSFIENILTEMEKIGWNKVQFLDPSFTSFRLSAKDSSSREHVLHIRFNSEDLFEKPSYQTDFPFSFHPKLSPQDGVLIPVYQEFVQELALYQDFWNNMDELDENCWILEAEARLRSCNYRRIALGNHCSVVLSIDPKQPRSFPEFRFLGADHIVIPLREKLNRNLFRWDQDKSILENLEMLFESKLPSPEQANSQPYFGKPFSKTLFWDGFLSFGDQAHFKPVKSTENKIIAGFDRQFLGA
eukprot:gene19941-21894_t